MTALQAPRWRLLFLIIAILLAVSAACSPPQTATEPTPASQAKVLEAPELKVVWEAWHAIQASYLDEASLDTNDLLRGAIMALLDEADIPPYPFLSRLSTITQDPPSNVPPEMRDIWRVWALMLQEHPELDRQRLAQAAAQGLVQGVRDPFTRFISSEEFEANRDILEGNYEGIGAIVSEVAGGVALGRIFPGSPAESAGLREGDIIKAVNGEPVQGLSLRDVVDRVKGPSGTEVRLLIERAQDGRTQQVEITVLRGQVSVPTVSADMLPEAIGYVYISQFNDTTPEELRKALAELREAGVRGLVLDLRNNPGGSVRAAVGVASQFLSDGIVLYEIDRGGERRDFPVVPSAETFDLPLAVVVNGLTVSASEAVAGALQDHQRAKLFGTTTYGKGAVLQVQRLSDGSLLYVTAARWYTPGGRLIQGKGIEPDITVQITAQDVADQRDTQLQSAHQYLVEQVRSGRR